MKIPDIPQDLLDFVSQLEPDDWQDPEEIRRELPPVPGLTKEMLPPELAEWTFDIAERMQCPPDYVAAAVVVEVGALVGAACAVRPKAEDDWIVIPNLWGGIVGDPASLKSPALSDALRPISQLETDARQQYERDMVQHAIDEFMHKTRQEGLKADIAQCIKSTAKHAHGDKASVQGGAAKLQELQAELRSLKPPVSPQARRYKTNDSTVEKLVEILRDNPRGLLNFRDELMGMLARLDREEHAGDRAFYLEAWNGDGSYTSDRIGRGTVHAPRVCLSLLGGIQPSKLERYLAEAISGYENDGFVQRLQVLVYPDPVREWHLVDRKPDEEVKRFAYAIMNGLANADFVGLGALEGLGNQSPYFRFDSEAQELFNGWLTKLECKLRGDDPDIIKQHLGKYRSLIPSLALLFHLVDLVAAGVHRKSDGSAYAGLCPISARAVERAIAWSAYLEAHARRIYGISTDPRYGAARRLSARVKKGDLASGFTSRDVYRRGWAGLTIPEEVDAAIRELVDAGWLRTMPLKLNRRRGRPPLQAYEINPKIGNSD